MSVSNIFGPIVTGRDVRKAMETHLKLWFPTYLAELCRLDDRDPAQVPLFRSWVSALDLPEGKFEEHQMPACVIVAPGILTEPEKRGGSFIARWAVSVGCVVAGQDRESTFALAELYSASVRAAVVQNPSLGGFASGVDWLGERYDDVPNDMLRTLAAGSVQFAVEVQVAVRTDSGPDQPLVDPIPDPGPRATFVQVDASTEGI